MKNAFAFFQFYYYIFTNNKNRYKFASDNHFPILIMPVIFLVLHIIVGAILLSNLFSMLIIIHLPSIVGNLLICHHYNNQYLKIQRKKAEKEREERRREDRRQFEKYWRRFMDEELRRQQQRREQEYRQQQQRRQQYQRNTYHKTSNGVGTQLDKSLKLLGLNRNATKQDIKSAYRKLSKIHHPDAGGKHENFVKINKAYKYAIQNTK